jgi:uncharacterized Tic20 family protein
MTSFPPHPEPQRQAASADVPGARPATHLPSRPAPGAAGRPPGGNWRTGPDEDWHTGSQPALPAARWQDQPLASLPPQFGGTAQLTGAGIIGGEDWQQLPGPPGAAPSLLGRETPGPPGPEAARLPGPEAARSWPGPAGDWLDPADNWSELGGNEPESAGEQPGDRAADAISSPVRDGDEAWAMLSYLGVPFVSILAPLAVILVRARGSDYVRQHATQALNLSITLALYNICALIMAGMLALDAVGVAVAVAVPAALVLWLVTLSYLVRAAMRASIGEFYRLPRWICATIAR